MSSNHKTNLMSKNQTEKDGENGKVVSNEVRPNAHPLVSPKQHGKVRGKTKCGLNNGTIFLGHISRVKLDMNNIV